MSTFKYFSYGSNMLAERLQARCPSARIMGVGRANGYELRFSKLSKDGSGKAMPYETGDESSVIYGVLFEIDLAELASLDKAEAAGFGYDRLENFPISFGEDQKDLHVTTYLANREYINDALLPFDWYVALVIAGAQQHNFPANYIEQLHRVSYVPDPDHNRVARKAAIKALRLVGHEDYKQSLIR